MVTIDDIDGIVTTVMSDLEADVGSTLGPNGSTFIYKDKDLKTSSTKDGETVLRYYNYDGEKGFNKNLIRDIVANNALKVAKDAGDGTTSCTIITATLYKALKEGGIKGRALNKCLDEIEVDVMKYLETERVALTHDNIESVLNVALNNDAVLSKALKDIYDEKGLNAYIEVKASKMENTLIEYQDGFIINSGIVTPALANKNNGEYINSFVDDKEKTCLLLLNDKTDIESLNSFLSNAEMSNMCIFYQGEDIERISDFINGKREVSVMLVGIPQFGQVLIENAKDLDAYIEFKDITLDGKESFKIKMVKEFHIHQTKYKTTIRLSEEDEKKNTKVDERCSDILKFLENKNIAKVDVIANSRRMGNMNINTVVIHVGGATALETSETKDRIDDAVGAIYSAMGEGLLLGGGSTLYRLGRYLTKDNEKDTVKNIIKYIVGDSLTCIYNRLEKNIFTSEVENGTLDVQIDPDYAEAIAKNFNIKILNDIINSRIVYTDIKDTDVNDIGELINILPSLRERLDNMIHSDRFSSTVKKQEIFFKLEEYIRQHLTALKNGTEEFGTYTDFVTFENKTDTKVLDTFASVRLAISQAFSTVKILLNTEGLIVDFRKESLKLNA